MSKDSKSKIKQLARQIKSNPEDSFSKFALALEFKKQQNFNNAGILFEDILENDPGYVGVYYHLAKLYEERGQLNDAQKLYQRGIKIADKQDERRTKKELSEALLNLKTEIDETIK